MIQYLIEEQHMDPYIDNIHGFNILSHYEFNPSINLSTIKYFVENKKIPVHLSNIGTLISYCYEKYSEGIDDFEDVDIDQNIEKRLEIIIFLLENIKTELLCAKYLRNNIIGKMIPLIKNNNKLNYFLSTIGFNRVGILKSLNPLRLNLENQKNSPF